MKVCDAHKQSLKDRKPVFILGAIFGVSFCYVGNKL